jgi:hypothetical protein
MSDYETIKVERTDLEQRDVRALTEYMTVLPLGSSIYSVTTQSGSEYRVDTIEERCTCPDHQHRKILCKHIRRVGFATGERSIPACVDTNEVDPQLGKHVDETPKVTASDGGVVLDDSGSDLQDDDRPNDCGCTPLMENLPCWPCYRDGFESPNPIATPEDEE